MCEISQQRIINKQKLEITLLMDRNESLRHDNSNLRAEAKLINNQLKNAITHIEELEGK